MKQLFKYYFLPLAFVAGLILGLDHLTTILMAFLLIEHRNSMGFIFCIIKALHPLTEPVSSLQQAKCIPLIVHLLNFTARRNFITYG